MDQGKGIAEMLLEMMGGATEKRERVQVGKLSDEALTNMRAAIKEREAMHGEIKSLLLKKNEELEKEKQEKLAAYGEEIGATIGLEFDAATNRNKEMMEKYFNEFVDQSLVEDTGELHLDPRDGTIVVFRKNPANE